MAKHVYEELEVDEHDIATHWITRNGIECWAVNEYKPNGRIKDVHIIRMKFPKGFENAFGHIYEDEKIMLFPYKSSEDIEVNYDRSKSDNSK